MVLKGSICEKIYETYTNLLQLPTTYLTEIEPLSLREMSAIVKSELNVLTVPGRPKTPFHFHIYSHFAPQKASLTT